MVLIAGGSPEPGQKGTFSTDLFNTFLNTFAPGALMNVGRTEAAARLLPNGKVLIAGGVTVTPSVASSSELYTP